MTHAAEGHRRLPAPLRATPEMRRFALFLVVGSAGLATDAALYAAASAAGLCPGAGRILSLGCATAATWWLNRTFTFAVARRAGGGEMLRYAAVTLAAQGFSFGLFLALLSLRPALPPLVALATGSGAAAALSFAGQRLFTFRPA